MRKIFILLVSALLTIVSLQAASVDVNRAKALGVKFMEANTELKSVQADLIFTAYAENGQAAFYVFAVQPKGFVIVSADDRAKPILGYSTESNFTPQLPDGLMTFFDNYKAGFSQMFANNDERTPEAAADWTSLEATGRPAVKRVRNVEPLLASIWNQTDLYNNMAPEDPNSVYSGHCKAGCVANTMSQIMRYWEWPRHGQGGHSYNANTQYGNYGWQQANFEDATYRFELMPDFLDFASPQAEVDATALLEYHAGVSVEMMYGANASGAYSQDVPNAFLNYFRYSPDMYLTTLDYFVQSEWEEMLMSNLDAGMPLYYASSGPDGGHAYVMDGYDDYYMFHMNWGWAGFDNGYYSIDGFYLTFYSFPWYHMALFNLHPDDEYYDAPMAVEMEASVMGLSWVELLIDPVFETRGGESLDELDVYIMRDGVVIDSMDLHDGIGSEPWIYWDETIEKNGTYYYTVYAVNEAGMSKVARDTVVVGSTCDVRFELADAGGNGWDMSSIAVLDEDGKVSQRVGLWDGGSASITVPVPNDQKAIFFWTYDNTCYSHGSLSEVSYEIYDWDDNLIVASSGYPEVGEIVDYDISCSMDCRPVFNLEGVYEWQESGEFGAKLTWDWDGNVNEFEQFVIAYHHMVVAAVWNSGQTSCFVACDEPGTMDYEVYVYYRREGGEQCISEPESVTVEVTSVEEQNSKVALYPNPASQSFTVEGNFKEIMVFDALGQLVHQGMESIVDVSIWPEGVYFVRIVDENDAISTVKFVKQ